jgi:hypothetical protein
MTHNQSVDTDLSELRKHVQSANATDERTSRNRKRNHSNKDESLKWEPIEYGPPPIRAEHSVPKRPPKKLRLTSPTISPPLLLAANMATLIRQLIVRETHMNPRYIYNTAL